LISTHDPLLALSADRRLVIKNGGLSRILKTTPEEQEHLKSLEAIDRRLSSLRNRLRAGEEIDFGDFRM
jgi:hypothetical protein